MLYMSVPWKYYSKYIKPLCMVEFAVIINSIIKELMHGIFLQVLPFTFQGLHVQSI